MTECCNRHSAADVLAFFKKIDRSVPADSTSTSCSTTCRPTWRPRSPTGSLTPNAAAGIFTSPTSSGWLNLVERWFAELTERRLRRGVFTSVSDLVETITTWADHWNDDPKPFIWHKAPDEIIDEVRRGRAALRQIKSVTHHSSARRMSSLARAIGDRLTQAGAEHEVRIKDRCANFCP